MRKKTTISRTDALAGIPIRAPVTKTEHKGKKFHVTIEFERPGWQRALGADSTCQRTFGLDAYGGEIYNACDGKHTVKDITERFAKNHHVSLPESEIAVTTFLKTLIGKGLIGMAIEERAASR